jgi:hypothetical protein
LPPGGLSHQWQPSPQASGGSSRHRRTAGESFMRTLARHSSRRLCTGFTAFAAGWVWRTRLTRTLPSWPRPGEARDGRSRLWREALPAHRRMPRGGRERARRRSHVPRHRLSGRSPLQARLAVRPTHVVISLPSAVDVPVGRAWSIPWPRSSSGQELIGTAAPPMMMSGQYCILSEVERERAHPRWRARSGHR